MNFVAGVPIGFWGFRRGRGREAYRAGRPGGAGQLRGHVLVVVILAAELPSRQGVMHNTAALLRSALSYFRNDTQTLQLKVTSFRAEYPYVAWGGGIHIFNHNFRYSYLKF